jgi:2-dehydro-3-deoxygalactonokinase
MKPLITIDWGTTSFRATRWNCGHTFDTCQVLDRIASNSGLMQLPVNEQGKRDFEGRLVALLQPWLNTATSEKPGHILLSGMVGSKNGWQEAPYCATPANLQLIARACVGVTSSHPALSHWQCLIAPGVRQAYPADVMRGEETQLLGCAQDQTQHNLNQHQPQIFVMPGTHSKHVWMHGSVLTKFATMMTGELFNLLSEHSVLKPVIDAQSTLKELQTEPMSRHSFINGLKQSLQSTEPLLQRIFSLRAQALLASNSTINTREQLSGLLIGDELKTLLGIETPVQLIGEVRLCERYQWACSELGLKTIILDSQAAERGALKLFLALHGSTV